MCYLHYVISRRISHLLRSSNVLCISWFHFWVLVGCWSSPAVSCHCVTTSWLAAATEMTVTEPYNKQASIFICLINKHKDIISRNNVQGQAARKAHKAQHCWPPCKKNLTKNIYMCTEQEYK